ncbi:hypothetical protein TWF506_006289 [Arthrobotrys conoides]|uniref:Uncharacterized protein n=1 Tax=Arthrobotrys conoides TaxID=74498 RepID=A0AAN8NLS8_9PEZI
MALQPFHESRYAHRDTPPANILERKYDGEIHYVLFDDEKKKFGDTSPKLSVGQIPIGSWKPERLDERLDHLMLMITCVQLLLRKMTHLSIQEVNDKIVSLNNAEFKQLLSGWALLMNPRIQQELENEKRREADQDRDIVIV